MAVMPVDRGSGATVWKPKPNGEAHADALTWKDPALLTRAGGFAVRSEAKGWLVSLPGQQARTHYSTCVHHPTEEDAQ